MKEMNVFYPDIPDDCFLPGDYVRDGLLYCGKCNSKKYKTVFEFQGKRYEFPCICECEKAQYVREQEIKQYRRSIEKEV